MQQTPSLQQSEDWARAHLSPAGRMPVWQWREQHRAVLTGARKIFVPNEDVAERMQHFFAGLQPTLRAHPETVTTLQQKAPTHAVGQPLQVAIIGRLTAHKGYDVLLQLAQDAKARALAITYHVFGDTDGAAALQATGKVQVHGAYAEGDIGALLQKHQCHLALFTSVWPETYSYTLSIALTHGVYPVCYDLGAPAARIKALGWGSVLPREQLMQPQAANDALLALETSAAPTALGLANKATQYPSLWKDFYGAPL